MSAESGGVTPRIPPELLDLAKQAAAPRLTETGLARRFGPRSTWSPAAAQLWRATLDEVTALVVLLAVEDESVTAAPVTVDPTVVGDGAVVLDGSTLGLPIIVWAELHRSLPIAVLDRPIDDLGAGALRQVLYAITNPDKPLRAFAAANDVRAELDDDLAVLAAAGDPMTVTAAAPPPDAIDLDTVNPEALETAAQRLGLTLPDVLDLIDGKRPATQEEARVLGETLGGVPATIPPPVGLIVELEQPRWRGLVRQHRRRGDSTENSARIGLAYEVNAMAARQTGEQRPSWPDRIRRWAQAHQLDVDAET